MDQYLIPYSNTPSDPSISPSTVPSSITSLNQSNIPSKNPYLIQYSKPTPDPSNSKSRNLYLIPIVDISTVIYSCPSDITLSKPSILPY